MTRSPMRITSPPMIDGSVRTVVSTSLPSCLRSDSRMCFSSVLVDGDRGDDLRAHDARSLVGERVVMREDLADDPDAAALDEQTREVACLGRGALEQRQTLRARVPQGSSSDSPARSLTAGSPSTSTTPASWSRQPAMSFAVLREREVRLGVAAGDDARAVHRQFWSALAPGLSPTFCSASSMSRWCVLASIADPEHLARSRRRPCLATSARRSWMARSRSPAISVRARSMSASASPGPWREPPPHRRLPPGARD